jgi:hypothetical protein
MAISLSTAMQNALNDYERYGVVLITFEFGTGVYGLWTGLGEITYNGIVYKAGASLLEISNIENNADGSVSELTISLNTDPNKIVTSDILATFYDEDWHMKPVTIQLGLINPDTLGLIGVTTFFRGRVEEAPFEEGPEGASIKGRCVSRSIELSKGGNLYRNEQNQKRFDPNDTGLNGIGTLNGAINRDLKWGQN